MINSQEKQQLMDSIFKLPIKNQQVPEVEQQIYDLLMRDTVNGKLYKYRTFDPSGFSLQNLRDGTLHCDFPCNFNDPFDSKIGFTFRGLTDVMIEGEMQTVSDAFEAFRTVLEKEKQINDYAPHEQQLITNLLSNIQLVNFLEANLHKITTEEELQSCLFNNRWVLIILFQELLNIEEFANRLPYLQKHFLEIINSILQDGIFQSLIAQQNSESPQTNTQLKDCDEINRILHFLEQQNFDQSIINNTQQMVKSVSDGIDRVGKLFKIGCLGTDYKNRLMWSHYTDSHRGFCIEYDFHNSNYHNADFALLPVIYTTNRPTIPWAPFLRNTTEERNKHAAEIITGLLSKDAEWQYENEWRILIPATKNHNVKMPPITCVYLGMNVSLENRRKIMEIAQERNIIVKQMVADRGTYELHAEEIVLP